MINNIYWVGNLSSIGGVETAMYELAKQFKDYDFVIYYNSIPDNQLNRLKKYVKCIKYNGEKLKCKKLFMNYNISIIDNVEAEEYIEIVHAVFKYNTLKPNTHPKITHYYAVSEEACESFKELTGKECEVLHNLLQIDKSKRVLKLISATRIAIDKGKMTDRMQKLVNELELNNIPYLWIIFTNGPHIVKGEGVVYGEPTLDIRKYIADADYLVQLSDTEAFCYSVLESLYLNTPVIVTPIHCFTNEMKIENKKNGYILDFDMKKIPIYDIYNNIPKFTYQPFKNEWEDKIVKVKSNYEEERKMKFKVMAKKGFENVKDAERSTKEKAVYFIEGDIWETNKERADYLQSKGVVEIVEELKNEPEKIEIEAIEEQNEEKVKKSKKKKNKK